MKKSVKTKRGTKKYPYLNKDINLKSRRYVLEADQYVNGVYDEDGNQVIRALNDEEKAWLNQFLAESVGAEKLTNKSIHKQNPQQKKRLKEINDRLKELRPIISDFHRKYNTRKNKIEKQDNYLSYDGEDYTYDEELDKLDKERAIYIKERETLEDERFYLDYQKYNNGCNNDRNVDLYNMLRRTGKLRIIDPFKLSTLGHEDIEDYAIKHIYTEYEAEDFQEMVDKRSEVQELLDPNDNPNQDGDDS